MENYFTVLGIFSCLVGGCFAQEFVTVGNDQTVKPTTASAPVDVTLTCTGSRTELSYYIKNRIQWDFIRSSDGKKFALTESFYQAPNSQYAKENFAGGHFEFTYSQDPGTKLYLFPLKIKELSGPRNHPLNIIIFAPFAEIGLQWTFVQDGHLPVEISLGFYLYSKFQDEKKYSISYREGDVGYYYNLKIKGVTHADNGVYQCSLLNEANAVTDSKTVTLTVVNPVESLSFELYHDTHKIGQSSTPLTADDTPHLISPGQYMVKCMATGSNPAPILKLYHNENTQYTTIETHANPADGRMQYTGSFSIDALTLNAHSSPQTLSCTANIPGEFYPTKTAAISVLVQVDKPDVHCDNASASIGDRNKKIICYVTAHNANDALFCGKTSWLLANREQVIEDGQRWKDPTGDYDIIESKCEASSDGLKVELELYTVKDSLFKETYFILYGVGENAHRHPVVLHDVTPVGGSSAVVAMSLLGYLVMAALTKHLANL